MFMGIAQYKNLNIGKNFSKPTASIAWTFTSPVHRNKTKHLHNPYNFGKPIFDAQDGMVIRQDIGEELIRIYSETERHN
ncbi:YTH domain-containing protein 1-like [Sitophilus oryzae]|nr:YTH domain-containing protein 1-like [Sitophilus oryzae]